MDWHDRESIKRLLRRWAKGDLDKIQVLAQAEDFLEGGEPSEFSEDDPRSIAFEVVFNLASLTVQLITKEDIPTILTFLDTPIGEEQKAWEEWNFYWDRIDFKKRRNELAADPDYSQLELDAD